MAVSEGRKKMLLETWEKCEQNEIRISEFVTALKPDKSKLHYFKDSEFFEAGREFFKALDFFNEIIYGLTQESVANLTANNATANVSNFSNSQTVYHEYGMKLADIEIPKFSGDYLEWTIFLDLFQSAIDQNTRLPKVQKLYYLKTKLIGEA